jgi:hypothetical protein
MASDYITTASAKGMLSVIEHLDQLRAEQKPLIGTDFNQGTVATTDVAIKLDNGKPPMSLIPRCANEAEAEVLGFGAVKYDAHNWRKGFAWSRLINSAMRHLMAFADGEDVDPETGFSHIAHLRCCTGFLLEHIKHGLGNDDRYKRWQ